MEKGRKGRKEREGVERRREGKKIKWCWLVCFSLPPILLPFLFLLSLSFVIFFFLISFHLPCSIPVSFVLLLLVRSIKVYALPSTRLASPSHLSSHFFFFFSPLPIFPRLLIGRPVNCAFHKALSRCFAESTSFSMAKEHGCVSAHARLRLPTHRKTGCIRAHTHTHAHTHTEIASRVYTRDSASTYNTYSRLHDPHEFSRAYIGTAEQLATQTPTLRFHCLRTFLRIASFSQVTS